MAASQSRPPMSRRDFVTGLVGGGTAGLASWYLAPIDWHVQRLPVGSEISFAQHGEDLVIAGIAERLGLQTLHYVDIGAYDPVAGSNTYWFYRKGGRGLLIEPNVSLTERLRSVRPRDSVLPVGIGITAEREADYYVFNLAQNNTFDPEVAERLSHDTSGEIHLERVVKMPLVPINELLAEHFDGGNLDLLSIDVEGLDLAILETMDFQRYRPTLLCVEHHHIAGGRQRLDDYLSEQAYAIRGMTEPNTIYVDQRYLEKRGSK